jgi:hypothetical protein
MKKLFMAIMAVAAISLVGCKNDKNAPAEGGNEQKPDTTVTPPAGDDVPEGYVRILIQVPDGEECHGIYFKGSLNGSEWSGENTYVGLENAAEPVETAIRFKRIAEKSDFFQADFKLGTDGLQGAVCQQYPNDGSWQGKSAKVTLIADKTTLEGADQLELPQFHIAAGAKPGILALKIGAWENSECVKANEAGQAVFTMKSLKALPEGTQVGITGTNLVGKANWDHENPIVMQKNGDNWMAIAEVGANCVYKYVIKFADEPNWNDRHGHILAGDDKGNISMPLNLQPVDEVVDWIDFDNHAQAEDFVPADHQFGLIGDAVGGWGDGQDIVFAYGEKDGDFYVAEATNVAFAAAAFKIRENGKWDVNFGWSGVTIEGDAANFEEAPTDGNIQCKVATTYAKVVFKFKWNGAATTDRILEFVK